MAKTSIVNLDTTVINRVHSPRVDGNPIYARVDGGMESGDGRSTTKTEKWANVVEKSYSSPDNIRRVFITHRAVYIHLYRPIPGVNSGSLRVEKTLKLDMNEVLPGIFAEFGQKPEYKVTGTGIAAIARPWVCSNIEELYFDWSIFISYDIMNMGFGNIYNDYILKQNQVPLDIIKQLFNKACMSNIKEIRTRFPRLRSVGYIQSLEEIYNSEQGKSGVDSIDDLKKPWCINSGVKAAIQCGQATIWKVEGLPELNYARSVKPNIYVFDRDILEPYFNNLESRIRTFIRSERDKKSDTKREKLIAEAQSVKGSFEKMMDKIYSTGGIESVRKSIMITLKHSTSIERKEIYESLTSDGKIRYGDIFGIK